MMVTSHVVVGMTSSLFFVKDEDATPSKKACASALTVNIALHGVMDLLPHNHPLPAYLDIIIALLIAPLMLFVKKKYRILVFICYLGSIMPDVIDLGVLRVLQFGSFRIFPWHYHSVYHFVNNLYTNSMVNMMFDISIIAICAGVMFFKRKQLSYMLIK